MDSILTVTQAAATHDLTTQTIAADELDADPTTYTRLSRWISEASGLIESHCNRVLVQETVQEAFRLDHHPWMRNPARSVLRLARYPVASIASVTEDGVTLTAGTDYEADPITGQLWRLDGVRRCAWRGCAVVVAYTGGYAAGAIPYPLQQACLTLIKHRAAARGRDPMLKSQTVPGVIEESYWIASAGDAGAMPPEVEDMLAPYREIPV